MNPICIVHDGDERALADARLISAAPELLEGCREAANYFRANGGAIAAAILARLDTAIAKAEGR